MISRTRGPVGGMVAATSRSEDQPPGGGLDGESNHQEKRTCLSHAKGLAAPLWMACRRAAARSDSVHGPAKEGGSGGRASRNRLVSGLAQCPSLQRASCRMQFPVSGILPDCVSDSAYSSGGVV